MRYSLRITLLLAMLLVTFAIVAGAADSDPVTVTGVLKAAGCPLTDEQAKTIADIDPDSGREARRGINDLFTEEQTEALAAKLGEMNFGGFGGMGGQGGQAAATDRPRRVRNLYQVIILEKAGCPLTEKQITDLGNIEMGPDMMTAMQEIYTEDQSAALEEYGAMGGRGMGGFGGGGMGGGAMGGGGMR